MTKRKTPDSYNTRQNHRVAISLALTEFYQIILETDTVPTEPYLENDLDEKSDLIMDLDYGPDLKGEARITYAGAVHILKNDKLARLFIYCRKCFQEILERTQLASKDVVTEEA